MGTRDYPSKRRQRASGRRAGRHRPGRRGAERWSELWLLAAGVGLLVGFALPTLAGSRRTRAIWFTDFLERASGPEVVGILLPALLGIATLVLLHTMRGRRRAITLFAVSVGALLFSFFLLAEGGFGRSTERLLRSEAGAVVVVFVLLLGAACVAAGNRIRKLHPGARAPRLLSGIAGCVMLLCLFVPIARDDTPLIGLLVEARVWEGTFPLPLMLLMALVYAVLGAVGFARGGDPRGYARHVTLVGRVILVGTPLCIVLLAVFHDRSVGIGLVMALKMFLVVYGFLAVPAVGLVAWVDDALRPAAAGEEWRRV